LLSNVAGMFANQCRSYCCQVMAQVCLPSNVAFIVVK